MYQTSWFNEPYNKMIQIRFETSERITEEKMEYKEEARNITRKEMIMMTMVVWTIRATEIMDHF